MRLGLHQGFFDTCGKISSSSGALFMPGVVHLAAAAGGKAQGLPAPLLLAGARCPSCPQQTGFLITHAASACLGARRQKPAAGERWLPLSRALSDGQRWLGKLLRVALDFHRTPLQPRGVMRKHVVPRATRTGGDASPYWTFSITKGVSLGFVFPIISFFSPLCSDSAV